jgi:uncharacterized protein YfaS (alpha-2-macroglobulin family)
LFFRKKYFSIFTQTDKALYKAGDLINFRLFAINSETLPANPLGAVITVFDPSNLKIKTFTNVTFVKGKHENLLQLSQSPPLGNWKIRVEVEGEVSIYINLEKLGNIST